MVSKNLTTIENMDKRNSQNYKVYDKGLYLNFIQIFGTNPWLWLVPIHGKSGMPIGDGVVWHKETTPTFDDEVQGIDEYVKNTKRNKVLASSLENVNASRDLISPKKEDISKRDTDQTLNSFRGNLMSLNDSNQL